MGYEYIYRTCVSQSSHVLYPTKVSSVFCARWRWAYTQVCPFAFSQGYLPLPLPTPLLLIENFYLASAQGSEEREDRLGVGASSWFLLVCPPAPKPV